jgi:hypothetical protein
MDEVRILQFQEKKFLSQKGLIPIFGHKNPNAAKTAQIVKNFII